MEKALYLDRTPENTPDSETPIIDRGKAQIYGHHLIQLSNTRNATTQLGGSIIDPRRFEQYYDQGKLRNDQNYVENCEKRFQNTGSELAGETQGKWARMLEGMFLDGVNTGAWLGNIDKDGKRLFSATAHQTTKFDDYRHNLDAVVSLNFENPIKDEEYNLEAAQIFFGVDVTTRNDQKKLWEKLTKSYNSNEELPFGFSLLDYYEDERSLGKIPMLPRYLIGISAGDVKSISETNSVDPQTGHMINLQPNSGQNLIVRFKILSEIRAQNELYQAMLPDDIDTEMLERADMMLGLTDQCLNRALGRCTEMMVARKCLPKALLQEVEENMRTNKAGRARMKIEKYLLDDGRKRFAENQQLFELPREGDDVYAQIITMTKNLTEASYSGELDRYRGVMVHNQKGGLPVELAE